MLRTRFVFLLAAFYVAGHTNAIAQTTERDQDVRGTWVVTVDGAPETRTLVISEVASTGTGALLAAKFGITGRGQSAVEARLRREGSIRHLHLVTKSAAIIAVAEQPDGSFTGSFTRKNGVASNVIVARTSASTQAAKPAAPKDLTALVPLSNPRPQIDFVYLGGSDCPHCRTWVAIDLPKLEASPAFQQVRFTHVVKAIHSPVPSSFWFPDEIKQFREPIAERLKGAGSPMFAILTDGKVVASWKGTSRSPEVILQIIDRQQRLLSRATTPNSTVERAASARPSP